MTHFHRTASSVWVTLVCLLTSCIAHSHRTAAKLLVCIPPQARASLTDPPAAATLARSRRPQTTPAAGVGGTRPELPDEVAPTSPALASAPSLLCLAAAAWPKKLCKPRPFALGLLGCTAAAAMLRAARTHSLFANPRHAGIHHPPRGTQVPCAQRKHQSQGPYAQPQS